MKRSHCSANAASTTPGWKSLPFASVCPAAPSTSPSPTRTPCSRRRCSATAPRAACPGCAPCAPPTRRGPRWVSAFEWATAADGAPQHDHGLLISAALEAKRIPSTPEVAQALKGLLLDTEMLFRQAIERGRRAGEIAGDVEPVQTGRALLALYLGLCVLVRSGTSLQPVLHAVVHQAQSLVPAPA